MSGLQREIQAFIDGRKTEAAAARQAAALQIACHVDLSQALSATQAARAGLILRLRRMIERERLRGTRRHWSYDLNRHMALKQALDRLMTLDRPDKTTSEGEPPTGKGE